MDLKNRKKTWTTVIFYLIVISSVLLFRIPYSLADMITYDYTGTHPSDGSTVSGSFGYDTDTVQDPTSTGRYITGSLDGAISGGFHDGLAFEFSSGTNAGDIFIQIRYTADTAYAFQIWQWIDFSAGTSSNRLWLRDQTVPLARTDFLLPTDLNLADYGLAKLYVDPPSGGRLAYDITSIEKRSDIPEPSTLLLLGAGLVGVGLFRRKLIK